MLWAIFLLTEITRSVPVSIWDNLRHLSHATVVERKAIIWRKTTFSEAQKAEKTYEQEKPLLKVSNGNIHKSTLSNLISINIKNPFWYLALQILLIIATGTVKIQCSSRSNCPEVLCKKLVLKNFPKFKGKHQCWYLFFGWSCRLKTSNFIKKRLPHRSFPVHFVKFLRKPFLYNTPGQLPLIFKKSFSLETLIA